MVSKPKVFASHAERRRWDAQQRMKDIAVKQLELTLKLRGMYRKTDRQEGNDGVSDA